MKIYGRKTGVFLISERRGKKIKNEKARMFIMLPGLLSERTFMSVLEYFMMTDQSGCYKQVQIQRVSKQALFLTDTVKKNLAVLLRHGSVHNFP